MKRFLILLVILAIGYFSINQFSSGFFQKILWKNPIVIEKAPEITEEKTQPFPVTVQTPTPKVEPTKQDVTPTQNAVPIESIVPTKSKILEKFATIVYDGTIYSQGAPDGYRILKKFYETHPDVYDFIAIYSAIPFSNAFGAFAKNGIRGNGSFYPDLDETAKFGSQGKLLFEVSIPPQSGIDNSDIVEQSYILLHEISHYWLMFIGDYADCKANPDFSVKCKNPPTGFRVNNNGAHWDLNVEAATRENGIVYDNPNSYGSKAYNYSNGYCTSVPLSQPRRFRFNDLDLYLMGLLFSNEAKPINWYDFTDASEAGQKCIQHTLGAQDIINMEGPRQPAYPTAQRDFKIGFVLVTAPNQNPTQQQIDKLNNIIDNFPKAWNEATKKLSTMTIPL